MTSEIIEKLGLSFNPFEPAASGAPIGGVMHVHKQLKDKILEKIKELRTNRSTKPITIVGEYGSGKTYLLQWLHRKVLPEFRVRSFYFDNPGVQFYDLANSLLRQIGRKDFAKTIWELAGTPLPSSQLSVFPQGYEDYIESLTGNRKRSGRKDLTKAIAESIKKPSVGITEDEEIAYCLSRMVTESIEKPYFDFRDFIPRSSKSLVAEGQEPAYFNAILKVLSISSDAKAIAFLVDEFEEIGLQKMLGRREAYRYLATMKRLIDICQNNENDFWLFTSMTDQAATQVKEIDPALWERTKDSRLDVPKFEHDDAINLIKNRIKNARAEENRDSYDELFPFQSPLQFRPTTISNPRRIVKVCSHAIREINAQTALPFERNYLLEIEERLYPTPV